MPASLPSSVPPETRDTIERCAAASHEGRAHFGEIVQALAAAGVEAYHVDYRAARATYHLPDGRTHDVALPPSAPVAPDFDRGAVVAAIRGAQRGEVKYPAFLARTQAAGCAGYAVWLAGRHVLYFGRRGEQHVERFPDG